jgi:Glycosyltransferase family 87
VLGLVLLSLAFVVYHLFDFKIFWEAGKNLLDGERIYPSHAELDLATRTYFVYPPVVAVAFVPFSLLPLVVAGALYSLLALLATGMTLRVLGIEDKRCYIALLFWMPVLQGVGLGTIAPFLALALAIAWKYRHSALTMPLVLSVAVVAKLFLWPLLFWLVATRRWRAAALSGLATAVLVLVPWALLGFRDFDWYPHALRLLLDHEQQLGFSASTALGPLHANVVAPAIQLGAVLAIFFLARQEDGDRRSFSAAVICALLLSPLVWIHYFVVLVVPIALASRRFGWMWVLPAAAFWPPPNNLHHPWIASCVFCVFAVAGGLTLLPGARIRRLGSAWPGRYGPTVHGDPDSVRPSLSG